jgi:chondroitin AC lyase
MIQKSLLIVVFCFLLGGVVNAKQVGYFKRDPAVLAVADSSLKKAVANYKYLMKQLPADRFPVTINNSTGGLRTSGSEPWVGGFYPGTLLYLYEASGDTGLNQEALRKLKVLEKEQYNKTTHDLGFMMYCSFGNAYRLYPDPAWRTIMIESARSLASRFNEKVGCIRSWDSDAGRFMVIIDNMMNLELLFAATRFTGDSSFYKIAVTHANTTLRNHFRSDYSSHHLVIYDPETGAVIKKQTVQGASDSSAWSRGQAWGLYGYTMTYRETKDKKYLQQADHIAAFMLRHLPADGVFYWDFNAPGIPNTARDASAAAVTSSALFELAGYVSGKKRAQYLAAATRILKALSTPEYFSGEKESGGFILKHGTGNFPRSSDIDAPLIYADYYYVEALMRYTKSKAFTAQAQMDTILQRYKRWLLQTSASTISSSCISSYDSIKQWPDIDYKDAEPANWKTVEHLKRVRDLSRAWSDSSSAYYHDTTAWQVINSALGHWLQKRYQSVNWWHNKIGVPQYMRDILVLLRYQLPGETYANALQVMAQYGNWQTHTGANLVWSADIALHYGALTGNSQLIQTCSRMLVKELRIDTADGIQPDYSFHQHGDRLQMYQYGAAFLRDNLRLAWQLKGTSWYYPAVKIKLLTDFILNGWQWMARGIHAVPGTMDRSVSRPNALHAADIRTLTPFMCQLDTAHASEFKEIAERQNGGKEQLKGFRYFPYSDFAAYHTGSFSFFLKTISTRTLPAESINHENLKGKLLNSGDAYLVKNGNEYFNLMPVMDWEKLPGLTAFAGAEKILRKPFTGAVSDGNSGAAVMDFCLQGNDGSSVTARKAWFCHNGQVVCLVAGLQKNNVPGKVYTSLDQCREQGAITKNQQWIHHAGIGYILLQPSVVLLQPASVTGSWKSINASAPGTPVAEKIFNPLMVHSGLNEGYVLAACKTPEQTGALANDPPWTILRNDSLCQAVGWKNGVIFGAFYQKGSLQLTSGLKLTVGKPCLVLIKGNSVYASNPAFSAEELVISTGRKIYRMQLPADGSTTMSKPSARRPY